ncbi:MAG: sulfotransferase family protein [Wenzhouxiangella sp.]
MNTSPSTNRSAGAPATATSRVVFVIGAGRSGTSTLTRALGALGVELGNKFKRATRKNPTGFFEDADLLALSKAVRHRIGVRADSLRLIAPEELVGSSMDDLRHRASKIIRQRFGSCPLWGFKYGRTLRILPFWEPVLAELAIEPSFVIALRNPLSVARSRAKLDPRRGVQAASDLEWLISIVPYLRRTRPHRLVVVDYDDLMDAPVAQLSRLAAELELPPASSNAEQIEDYVSRFLDPGLRHTRYSAEALNDNEEVNPIVRAGYRLLRQVSEGRISTADAFFWQQWEAVEQGVRDLAPILQLIDLREIERRRALTSLIGPLQALSLLKPRLKNL